MGYYAVTNSADDRQRVVEDILRNISGDVVSVEKRLLRIARLGMDDVTAITPEEIKQVCFALVVHYHQLGIS